MVFLFLSFHLAPGQTPAAVTNTLRPDAWDVDGTVHALLATNGVIYVGGAFSYAAPRGNKVAALDAYTGESIAGFPPIIGSAVHAVLPDDTGGWFLAGEFTSVGGWPRTNLVHVRADFSVDPIFQPNPNAPVRALVLEGATLYVGGNFTSIAGVPRSRLAALALPAGTPTAWNPVVNDQVSALHLSAGVLFVGGRFSQTGVGASARPRSFLAAFDLTSNIARPWAPFVDGEVVALVSLEERVIVGGQFNVAGATSDFRNGLAAFHRDTGELIGNWDPNPRAGPGSGGKVTSLQLDCTTLHVGGHFTTIGGASRARVAAVDVYTGLATDWDARLGLLRASSLPSSIQTIALAGSTLFLGGEFNAAGGEARTDLIAVDLATGQLLAWNPQLNGGIAALGVAGRTLLAALVTGPGGVERRNLAAFDEITGRPLAWVPDPNDAVQALAFAGSTVFAGGKFTEVGGQPHLRLAALDAASGLARANWSTNVINSNVQALAISGGRVFAGGAFTSVNGQTRRRLAAFDLATGQLIDTWAPAAEPGEVQVQALAADANALYVGGSFTQLGLDSRPHLGAVSPNTGQVLPWNPIADQSVRALAVAEGVVYAGGEFTTMGGLPRAGAAAIEAASGLVTAWNPGRITFDLAPDVRALAVAGPIIYLAGSFLELADQPRLGLGAVRADNTLLDWNPGASPANALNALAVSPAGVFAGGNQGQSFVGGNARRALAFFPRIGAPGLLSGPVDAVVPEGGDTSFTALASGAGPLLYQWRFQGVALPGQTNATLSLTGLTVADSGAYEVTISNALGTIRAAASLLVLAPARIVVAPVSQAVVPGVSVTLAVTATGNPPPLYQWRLNGVLIPGAVYSSYVLTNVTPQSGGHYSVVVLNRAGAQVSDGVDVTVAAPNISFADHFTNRVAIVGPTGVGRGSNAGASREEALGEPRHAGKLGGASVWLKWIAPATGVARFATRGSGFDTLLGLYTNGAAGPGNGTLGSLRPVASDEDRGGFLTSRAAMNVQAGVEYQIAVDGLGGATGDIVLSWELEPGAADLPVIAAPPLSQTVAPGGSAVFSVALVNGTGARLQWYFGCAALPGATNDTLVLLNVQARHAGFYHVQITGPGPAGRVIESIPAALEIGAFLAGRSFEKLEDLRAAAGGGPGAPGGNGGGGGGGLAPAGGAGPFFLISLGLPISHTFSTSTNSLGELIRECGVLSAGAAFLAFTPGQSGAMLIDTVGSTFDTVLSIYNYVDPLFLSANFLGCDNDGAFDGGRSRLTMNTVAGHEYLARVGGVGGQRGLARINWRLEGPPIVTASNTPLLGRSGSGLTLDAGVTVAPDVPTIYQWFLNGTRLSDATNATLTLAALNLSMAGAYSVIVSNFAGVVTNVRANLQVSRPLVLAQPHWTAEGRFAFSVTGEPNESFVVRVSTHLGAPMPWPTLFIGKLPADAAPVGFIDAESSSVATRFYSVEPP
jgi:hypothetical protein